MSAMSKRAELSAKLKEVSGYKNLYFEPPESVKMKYPCIIYHRDGFAKRYASNRTYILVPRYQITIVDKDSDNGALTDGSPNQAVIEKLMWAFPYCDHKRHFVSDNLHHDILTIYF